MQEEHRQYLRTSELRRKGIVVALWSCHWDGVPSRDSLGRHVDWMWVPFTVAPNNRCQLPRSRDRT